MRVLVVSAPGYGHLYPLVPLARALADRRHNVAFAAWPGAFEQIVRELGLGAILMDCSESVGLTGEEIHARTEGKHGGDLLRATMRNILEDSVRRTEILVKSAARWAPDVIIRESTALFGWLAARLLDLPSAVIDFIGAPRSSLDFAQDLFDAARLRVGLDHGALPVSEEALHILTGPEGWFESEAMGPNSHLFGPPEEVERWDVRNDSRGSARPVIYVTLGTAQHIGDNKSQLFELIFEALGQMDVDVIATGVDVLDSTSIRRLPENCRVATSFVPQALILNSVDAMVAHAGYGTLMGALSRGIPVVSVPLLGADNDANASRLVRLGAGVAIRRTQRSVIAVRDAVDAILSVPRFRQAAAGVATSIAGMSPLSEASSLIEQLVLDAT